ncbi:hypothetical protein HYS85_01330 [Candidatus Saccharibacteria bacterium]|nr:hypothetical protein [Candidatus Saccharibacteria bacterium]
MALFGKKPVPPPADPAQAQEAEESGEVSAVFQKGVTALRDFIAPSSIEFAGNHFQLGTRFARTYYVYGYPRQVYTGWLSGMINIDEIIDLTMIIQPVRTETVLNNLRKKVSQLEAGIQIDSEKGRVRDPGKQAAILDAEEMRDKLQVGEERFFRFGFYFTIYANSLDELDVIGHRVESMLGQQLVYSKAATAQQEQGLNSTIPQFLDQLQIYRNMNTGAISTSFPFTSADLSQESGILYGINMRRFLSALVLFQIKLSTIYIATGRSSSSRSRADNALRSNLITLHGLLRLMMGGAQAQVQQSGGTTVLPALNPAEEADLDAALIETYAKAGITNDPLTHGATPPTVNDLYDTLLHMGGTGPQLAQRLRKYTSGTFAGIFSQQSNVNVNNPMVVFNIRDLEDELRPVAMYIVLNFIWNKTKADKKRRILMYYHHKPRR